MGSAFILQLRDFIVSPLGLVISFAGLCLLFAAQRSQRAAWLLFTFCCFAATLGKFQSEFIQQPPALLFPLDPLRDMGRSLTMVLLGLLVLLGFQARTNWRNSLMPQPVKYLVAVQTVIFFKTLFYGSMVFALLTALTIAALIFMINTGPSRWLQNEKDFIRGVGSIAMVGALFVSANLYQAIFDLYPITFIGGRFLGTTVNPQAAALLLGSTLPCCLFMVESPGRPHLARIFWVTVTTLLMLALLMTGSRTGLLMGATTILFFYRQKIGNLLRILFLLGCVFATLFILSPQDGAVWEALLVPATERYTSFDNSRELVWSALWSSFQAYPIFGVPLSGDRLMAYGESSWLGTAASLGLVGLLPLCLFGFASLRLMIQLYQFSHTQPRYFYQSSTVFAGLATIFVGSIFEASLLGNLTFSVLVMFFYLALGQYLVEFKQSVLDKSLETHIPSRLVQRSSKRPIAVIQPTIKSYHSAIHVKGVR